MNSFKKRRLGIKAFLKNADKKHIPKWRSIRFTRILLTCDFGPGESHENGKAYV
jgi:hypothetical protein